MKRRLTIDIGVLCDFLDGLCKNLILASGSEREVNLHDITVPRSWLMKPIDLDEHRNKQFAMLRLLVDPMSELLEQLYTGVSAGLTFTVHIVPN